MDGFFVRPREGAAGPAGLPPAHAGAAGPAWDRDDARQLVEEVAKEIVLDEASGNEFVFSPDERRLRSAGASSAESDCESDAGSERGSARGGGRRRRRPSKGPPGAPGAIDTLFARRREPAAAAAAAASGAPAGGAATAQQAGLADTFLARRRDVAPAPAGPPQPPGGEVDALFMRPPGLAAAGPKAGEGGFFGSEEGEEEEDEVLDIGTQPSGAAGSKGGAAAGDGGGVCRRLLVLVPAAAIGVSCQEVRCSRAFLRSAVFRRGVVSVVVVAVLVLLTVALATACDRQPIVRVLCVVPGFEQLIIAASPVVLAVGCFAWRLQRAYVAQRKAFEASWRRDGEAQRNAAEVLDALASAPAEERIKYVKQVVQILKDFPDKAVIQQKGCTALEAICRGKKGNPGQVQAAGAVPIVLQALEAHRRVRAVQRAALGALVCLAKVAKSQIFDLGGITSVLASMQKFRRDEHVQLPAALALGALCTGSSTNRKSVVRYHGHVILIESLGRHAGRADVLVACAEVICLLAEEEREVRRQLVNSASVVQNIILQYEDARAASAAAGPGAAKRARECEVALRSLRKLEALLQSSGAAKPAGGGDADSDAGSEAGTPRMDGRQVDATAAAGGAKAAPLQAQELQERLQRWGDHKRQQKRATRARAGG